MFMSLVVIIIISRSSSKFLDDIRKSWLCCMSCCCSCKVHLVWVNVQRPRPRPGMYVHGLPPRLGTGPFRSDWIFIGFFCSRCSSTRGLIADAWRQNDRHRRMVQKMSTILENFLLWLKPILGKIFRGL